MNPPMSAAAAAARPRCCCAASAPAWCAGLAASAPPAARWPPRFASLLATACCVVSSALSRYIPVKRTLLRSVAHNPAKGMIPRRHQVRCRQQAPLESISCRYEASRRANLHAPPRSCIAQRMASARHSAHTQASCRCPRPSHDRQSAHPGSGKPAGWPAPAAKGPSPMRPISALLGGGGTGYSHPIWTIDGGSELCAGETRAINQRVGVQAVRAMTSCRMPRASQVTTV